MLVAISDMGQTAEFPLEEGTPTRLGRAPRQGIATPWDMLVSREHADVLYTAGALQVTTLPSARNPVFVGDQSSESFRITVGEEFRIGHTRFRLVELEYDDNSEGENRVIEENELENVAFGAEASRLELLSQLPRLISQSKSDSEFAVQLVDLLLNAIEDAEAVAVLAYDDTPSQDVSQPALLRWNSRNKNLGRFRPSRSLIRDALTKNRSVVHFWDGDKVTFNYTHTVGLDWAYCTPLTHDKSGAWCFYVAGKSAAGISNEDHLLGDLRFTELLANFMSSIRKVRYLEHRHAEMTQYFSPAVVETLSADESETILLPKETDITVLFCDVRGFSRETEKAKHNLLDLLSRVSDALGVMTSAIMKYEGVIADFQGDAALAFWGWPNPNEEGTLSACLAALQMFEDFWQAQQRDGDPLQGFKVGIGIGHGAAVAGRIGTLEQVKVGVFGPVVNLAARLESMTKQFRVPILIDEPTAKYVRAHLRSELGRVRRLAKVRPVGVTTPVAVSELLPPCGPLSAVTDEQIRLHEAAMQKFEDGQWEESAAILDNVPIQDRAKIVPLVHMAEYDFVAPPSWDGIINLTKK